MLCQHGARLASSDAVVTVILSDEKDHSSSRDSDCAWIAAPVFGSG